MLSAKMLEIPMTILRVGFLRRLTWLRIFTNTTPTRLARIMYTAKRKELPVIVFMIHSSELMVGKSPYVTTEAELQHLYDCLESFFALCAGEHISGITASAFSRGFSRAA